MNAHKKSQQKPTRIKVKKAQQATSSPKPTTSSKHDRGEHIAHALEHAAHYLPAQSPISLFVHHNTLHAFQHMPFHQAVLKAGELLNANAYVSTTRFRQLMAQGKFEDQDIEQVLDDYNAITPEPSTAPYHELEIDDRALRYCWLTRNIEPTTPQALDWQLHEQHLLDRLPEDTLNAARITRGVEAWVQEALGQEQDQWLKALTGHAGQAGQRAFYDRFGHKASADALKRISAQHLPAIALSLMWTRVSEICEPASDAAAAALTRRDARRRATSAVSSLLSSMAALYMDEGQAQWTMPHRERGFYQAVLHQLQAHGGEHLKWLGFLRKKLKTWEQLDAKQATLNLLAQTEDDDLEDLIHQSLQLLPGWAGMFARLEAFPQERRTHDFPISLNDYLAIALLLIQSAQHYFIGEDQPLSAFFDQEQPTQDQAPQLHDEGLTLFLSLVYTGANALKVAQAQDKTLQALLKAQAAFDQSTRQRLLQEAMELSYERKILTALAQQHQEQDLSLPRRLRPSLQATFCIDDREESYRRLMEEVDPACETFGAAGFFGLAIAYRGIDDAQTADLCPVGVVPRHEILEYATDEDAQTAQTRQQRRNLWAKLDLLLDDSARGAISGTGLSMIMGPLGAASLSARILSPRRAAKLHDWIHKKAFPTPTTRQVFARQDTPASSPTRNVGYTLDERVERAATFFENIGAINNHARLFVVVGHGSSSQNNPHRAAYDCGACSGKHGGPNARLMADICNDPEVRKGLAARNIIIPEDTWFIGSFHDTCDDRIDWFDLDLVPKTHAKDLEHVMEVFRQASAQNALERCRRFASAQGIKTPNAALAHVQDRANHLSEPRPELGHATNALCIVGRRSWTRGLFLDRRAFLVCYDPSIDKEGKFLERIIAAAGPVGAGINLEYYFSHVDNDRYGCGTKLPHNMTGLIGVINGTGGDLRPGLPWQMVEVHEPIRLLVVVESTPARLLEIAGRQPVLAELILGQWIRLACIDPETHQSYVFKNGAFLPWSAPSTEIPTKAHSVDWFYGHMESLSPALISSAITPQEASR